MADWHVKLSQMVNTAPVRLRRARHNPQEGRGDVVTLLLCFAVAVVDLSATAKLWDRLKPKYADRSRIAALE